MVRGYMKAAAAARPTLPTLMYDHHTVPLRV